MSNNQINQNLVIAAVYQQDLEKVKKILNEGTADVNFTEPHNGYTLLHRATSVEIVKELLLHGADVNKANKFLETPLDFVAYYRRGVDLALVLLKHGANVNAMNRKGNTPLILAVRRLNPDLELVHELLKYGADINIMNWKGYTPLDLAASHRNPTCAKLLIKFTVIKNFSECYNMVYLSPNKAHNYSALLRYRDDCVLEIERMKTHKIIDDISLFEIVITNFQTQIIHSNKTCKMLSRTDISRQYPIYNDLMVLTVRPFLKKANLLDKLSTIKFYTHVDISKFENAKTIILDYDSTYNICEYLSDEDLSNFITSFE